MQSERGVFLVEQAVVWEHALSMATNVMSVFSRGNPWRYQDVYCRSFLGHEALMRELRADHFDVAVVDLLQNECMHAFAVDLGLPVVAFWLSIPSGMEMEGTPATFLTQPTSIPYFMSSLPVKMNLIQRLQSTLLKVETYQVPLAKSFYNPLLFSTGVSSHHSVYAVYCQ